jgi:hypothetical protein
VAPLQQDQILKTDLMVGFSKGFSEELFPAVLEHYFEIEIWRC